MDVITMQAIFEANDFVGGSLFLGVGVPEEVK
jgi:hypothetical protein